MTTSLLGKTVIKTGGSFQHTGTVVSEFVTSMGEPRIVIEFDAPVQGMLHVYRPDQVEETRVFGPGPVVEFEPFKLEQDWGDERPTPAEFAAAGVLAIDDQKLWGGGVCFSSYAATTCSHNIPLKYQCGLCAIKNELKEL